MSAVKATVISTRRKLLVRTDGGSVVAWDLIPHLKLGDRVWVSVAEGGKVVGVESLSCEHSEIPEHKPEPEKKIHRIDYYSLDSHE
jgi:uncharacterized protein YuzE